MPINSINDAIRFIINKYGLNELQNGSRCNAILSDIVPKMITERKMVAVAFDNNLVKILISANTGTNNEKEQAVTIFKKKLVEQAFLNDNIASEITSIFVDALEWNSFNIQDVQTKPEVNPDSHINSHKDNVLTEQDSTEDYNAIYSAINEVIISKKSMNIIMSISLLVCIIIAIASDAILYNIVSKNSEFNLIPIIIFILIYTICQSIPLIFSLVGHKSDNSLSNVPRYIRYNPTFKSMLKTNKQINKIEATEKILIIFILGVTIINVIITILIPLIYYTRLNLLPLEPIKMIIVPIVEYLVLSIIIRIILRE